MKHQICELSNILGRLGNVDSHILGKESGQAMKTQLKVKHELLNYRYT